MHRVEAPRPSLLWLVPLLAVVALGLLRGADAADNSYGGTLTVGIGIGDPFSLDPSFALGGGIEVMPTICEGLYRYDAKSQIEPQLAAALPAISKDHLTYTIPLRTGIQFNDGTPFNAAAVVTSLQRMMTVPGSAVASDFTAVDTITAPNQSTVVIHLKARHTPMVSNLALQDGIVMSPAQLAKLGANFGTSPVCVGPFMFDERVIGDHITVIKSPYYYDKYAVHLDKIIFKPENVSPAAAANALLAGDIQVLSGLDSTQVPAVQQSSGFKLVSQLQYGYRGIIFNLGKNAGTSMASTPLLRQAFETAIDRGVFVKLDSTRTPGCTPLSPSSPLYDPTIKCTPYDPAGARKLVARSGVASPTVDLVYIGGALTDTLGQAIQSMEAAVGIKVVLDPLDSAAFAARRASGNFDALLVSPAGTADPDRSLFTPFATSGSGNYGGYSNPRVDLILANGRKATDPKALKTLYRTAEKIIQVDRPQIVLYYSTKVTAFSTSLTGVSMNPDLVPQVAFAQYK
jgi:peptide/nickel transport system substrate-binding protein